MHGPFNTPAPEGHFVKLQRMRDTFEERYSSESRLRLQNYCGCRSHSLAFDGELGGSVPSVGNRAVRSSSPTEARKLRRIFQQPTHRIKFRDRSRLCSYTAKDALSFRTIGCEHIFLALSINAPPASYDYNWLTAKRQLDDFTFCRTSSSLGESEHEMRSR